MLLVLGLTAGLCVLQKDFGTALVFITIVLSLMIFAGIPWGQLTWSTAGIGAIGVLVLMKADNASKRLFAFWNLAETKRLDGYQVYQSLLSIANGGIGGTGIGSGTSKWGYVPLAYSDFVFAVISEELGLVGTVAVIGGYALLVFFGVRTALGARDMHGAFIAGGISAWFGFQTFINIGGIVGIIPMTGLTLPFMSYGGSSLMVTMIASGLLLNVARHMK
jgi:cell division protein FtsW